MAMQKPNLLEVYSVILLENAGYFLLLKRAASKSFAPGRWTGVGGRVEADEFNDLRASALRELSEETGLSKVEVAGFTLRRVLALARPDGHLVVLVYFTGELSACLTLDCPEGTLSWVAPSQLPELDVIETSRPVLQLLVLDQARDPQGLEPVHMGVGMYDPTGKFSHVVWG
jgi:8-oxo-dGTP diphosphatase